jgi:hypothetical protein
LSLGNKIMTDVPQNTKSEIELFGPTDLINDLQMFFEEKDVPVRREIIIRASRDKPAKTQIEWLKVFGTLKDAAMAIWEFVSTKQISLRFESDSDTTVIEVTKTTSPEEIEKRLRTKKKSSWTITAKYDT